jgi:flagellar motility protein MotE (MotC chaperone)
MSRCLAFVAREYMLIGLCLFVTAVLFLQSQAVAQERPSGSSQWSTTVQPARTSGPPQRKLPRGQMGKRPAAAPARASPAEIVVPPIVVPPVGISQLQSVPVVTAEPATASALAAAPSGRPESEAAAIEFCRNIAPIAGEARAAFLQQTIAAQERELVRKTAELEERITEHKQWIARRQEVMDQAGSALVRMFARMRPDAAAQQVSIMDEAVAAALLMKLETKSSSALLSEMPPARAARLAAIIAAAAEIGSPQRDVKAEPAR